MQNACECANEDVRDPETSAQSKRMDSFLFYRLTTAAALEFGHILASSCKAVRVRATGAPRAHPPEVVGHGRRSLDSKIR